jgi:hypothetical protein
MDNSKARRLLASHSAPPEHIFASPHKKPFSVVIHIGGPPLPRQIIL